MNRAPFDLQSEEGFRILHDSVYEFAERFSSTNQALANLHSKQSLICGHPGLADSITALASTMANQVFGEFQHYYQTNPKSEFDAVCWLQKVFVMCRMFGSESWIEGKNSRQVSKMTDPKSGLTFGELTNIDKIDLDPEEFGKVTVNSELHELVSQALIEGNPTQAVRLLCDSVKHGVLSPAINLTVLKTPQQIYLLGLMAMVQCVDHFIERTNGYINEHS